MRSPSGSCQSAPAGSATSTTGPTASAAVPVSLRRRASACTAHRLRHEILGGLLARGDWYTVIPIIGYAAALLTATYSFRAIYKVFYGELNEETKQIAEGHHLHFPPANPSTGEAEDYEVGFPGKEHHTAEDSAIVPFSTSVKSRFWSAVGVPTGTTRVISVVPPRYWPPESISSRPSPSITACECGVAR